MDAAPNILLLYNQIEFDSDEYGEKRLKKSAKFYTHQISADVGTYSELFLQKNEQIDEVDLLQLGQTDSITFYSMEIG